MIRYKFEALPEETPVRGNALASGDDAEDKKCEDEILGRLDRGDIYAWFVAKVTCYCDECGAQAEDYLGGCSYEDEADFRKDQYFTDMCHEARSQLKCHDNAPEEKP